MRQPGKFDHVITFYEPSLTKDDVGATVKTMVAKSGTVRAERIYKSSTERYEAEQQVGVTIQDFRIADVRTQYAIAQDWEFDIFCICTPTIIKRYKIRGIEEEFRRGYLKLKSECKDNV